MGSYGLVERDQRTQDRFHLGVMLRATKRALAKCAIIADNLGSEPTDLAAPRENLRALDKAALYPRMAETDKFLVLNRKRKNSPISPKGGSSESTCR